MPKRAPGPGRMRKNFPEQQGMAHVLALTQRAVEKADSEYQQRVDRSHAAKEVRLEAKKERQKRKVEEKSKSDVPTRADMVALLREKRREKTRERKSQRKQRDDDDDDDEEQEPSGPRSILKKDAQPKPKKRVSFS